MYSVYVDGECVYNDQYPLEEYKVISPVLKMADSAAGSLEMTLPPVNIGYDKLKRMKSTINVRRWDKEIWEGRLVEDSYDFWHNRKTYIEGALAYFNDTCQPQREYTNVTLDQFIQSVIDIHNSKVPDNRKIYFDYQNVDGGVIEYRATQYQKTLEVLNQVCTDYSCHMKIEKKTVNGVYGNYIKFFKGALTSSTQSVEFGKNLLDYTSNFDMSELATVVVPLGAVKTRANESQIGDAIDLTQLKAYNDDDGWGVEQVKTDETVLATQDEVENQNTELIHHYSGWYGYYTAVLLVKASTTKEKNVVYISSRMHAGFGMYIWQTVSGGGAADSYHSGKYSSIPLGFTDILEEAVEVPVSEDENGRAKTMRLYVGSFGGDVELRVNTKAKVSDQLDEYYTAEDALVSSVNLVTETPVFTQGNIHTINEENPGTDNDDGTKHIRTGAIFAGSGSRPFGDGLYSLKAAVASGKIVQARIYWYAGQSGSFVNNTDWETLPARFTLPSNDVGYRLRVVFRYPNSTSDFPTIGEITQVDIYKGEKFGSLYVTATSKNLFSDTLEQGGIIEDGNNAGLSNSGTDMKRIRSTKPIGIVKDGGDIDGFEVGQYLIHAKTTKQTADDARFLSVKPFFYDLNDVYISQGEWVDMPDASGAIITVPNRGSGYSSQNILSATPIFEQGEDSTIIKTVMKLDYSAFDALGSYKFEGESTIEGKEFYIRLKLYKRDDETLVSTTEWKQSPAEFELPDTVDHYKVVPEIKHTDSSDILPTSVKSFRCYKGEPLRSKIRFMFKDVSDLENEPDISISALSELMLEQGASYPSMYEPANSALEEYGWIETVINFDNCESPDELYYKAKTYLASGQFDKMTLTVKALDLSILGVDTDALDINSYILVNSRPHGLSRFFEISELDIPLDRPEDATFDLGSETQQTLTSINNNTSSDLLAKINAQTSQSYILDEARKNAEAAILDGFTSGAVVTITNDADQITGLGFFKVWNASTGRYEPYEGGFQSARWSDIVSNHDYDDVVCLLINNEGIVFYGNGVTRPSTITLANEMGQITANAILTGTMYADRILGGTLRLGETQDNPNGSLIVSALKNGPGTQNPDGDYSMPWSDGTQHEIVQINRASGVLQQGYDPDGRGVGDYLTRQIKMLNGCIEGSIYDRTVSKWILGGRLFLGDYYSGNMGGIRFESGTGPIVLSGDIVLDGTVFPDGWGSQNKRGLTQSCTFGTTTLRFEKGILYAIENE